MWRAALYTVKDGCSRCSQFIGEYYAEMFETDRLRIIEDFRKPDSTMRCLVAVGEATLPLEVVDEERNFITMVDIPVNQSDPNDWVTDVNAIFGTPMVQKNGVVTDTKRVTMHYSLAMKL